MKLTERIKRLKGEIRELMNESKAIVALAEDEDRDLNDDEKKRVDEILGSGEDSPGLIAKLEEDLARWEKIEAREKKLREPQDPDGIRSAIGGGGDAGGNSAGLAGGRVIIPATARRHGSLRGFVGDHPGGFRAEERAYRFGMFALALASRQLPNRYDFPRAEEFVKNHVANLNAIRGAAHAGGSGGTGAHFTIPDEFSGDLINLKESRGVVRQLFGRTTMMSDTKRQPRRTGGLTAYAVGENASGTESTMSFDDIELVARKWMVISRISKELDEDNAIEIGDVLAQEIAYAFADKEDEAGINGDGTSTYHGIIGARTRLQDVDGSGTDSAGLKTQGTGSTWGAIVLADFDPVVGALPDYADGPDTAWIMSRVFFYEVVNKLVEAAGGTTPTDLRQGERRPRPLFKGYPVNFSQVMPKTTATTSVVAMLGDWGLAATFGDRRDETIEFSDQVYVNSQSVWERDQIAVKGTERHDINVHEYGDSSNAGAFVGLQTGS